MSELDVTVGQLVEAVVAMAGRLSRLEGRVPAVKNQLGGVGSAPAVGDDVTAGWSAGSRWLVVDGADRTIYTCLSNAEGAAVWVAEAGDATGYIPIVDPATAGNLVVLTGDGELVDAGYKADQTATANTVVRRTEGGGIAAAGTTNNALEARSVDGAGARIASQNTDHAIFGSETVTSGVVSKIKNNGILEFSGGSAATNRAAQRVALGFEEASAKATPVDADSLVMIDSAASNVITRVTWANVKSVIQAAFDSIYVTLGTSQTIVAAGTKVWQGLQTFQAGANFSYSRLTSLVATAQNNVLWGRRADIDHLRVLDYQDEAALWATRTRPYDSITPSSAPNAGAIENIFVDDDSSAEWNTGTPFPITITIDSTTNPIGVKNNATWQVGLTFRSTGVTVTNIQIEIWDGSAYLSVHNAAPGANGTETSGFGYWISPRFISDVGTGYDIQRLRVTISGDNAAITNGFRIQRLMLYHDTAAWDVFTAERLKLVRLRPIVLPFYARSDGTVTLTNQPSAEQFLSNGNRNINLIDLAQFTQVRFTVRVTTASTSANDPRLRVRYATAFSTTVGDYVDIGTSEVAASLAATGVADSGWVNLAAGAMVDDVFVAVMMLGGDGDKDPVHGPVMVYFR